MRLENFNFKKQISYDKKKYKYLDLKKAYLELKHQAKNEFYKEEWGTYESEIGTCYAYSENEIVDDEPYESIQIEDID